MEFNIYQKLSARTSDKSLSHEKRILIAGLGLAGESGEVCDLIKKQIGHKHPEEKDKISEELSDVLWYCAELATCYGLSLDSIASKNIEKLKKRYPEGFSTEASINRSESNV